MKFFQRHSVQLLVSAMFLSVSVAAYAGNKAMVDNSVRELNELNAKALSQVAVPKDGHISIKGDVRYVNGVPDVHVTDHVVRQADGTGTIRLPHMSQPASERKALSASGTKAKRLSSSTSSVLRHHSNGLAAMNEGPVFRIQAPKVLEVRNESFGSGSRYVLSNYNKSGWQLATSIREEEIHAPVIAP